VVDRLRLTGSEGVLDAGCGTGKLCRVLLERLPQGRLIALDASADMLRLAREELHPFQGRVQFLQASLPDIPALGPVDAILSTATLHWVLDHPGTYRAFRHVIRPGGQLEFQCGGAGNLQRLHARATALAHSADYAEAFLDWREPWCLASAEETETQLRAAGWAEVRSWLEVRPTAFADAAAFGDFIGHVNLRPFLQRLAPAPAQAFIATLVEAAAQDTPPFVLDYVRLNASARAPGGTPR
jgi:trans-aconitate 2-methyltransferase